MASRRRIRHRSRGRHTTTLAAATALAACSLAGGGIGRGGGGRSASCCSYSSESCSSFVAEAWTTPATSTSALSASARSRVGSGGRRPLFRPPSSSGWSSLRTSRVPRPSLGFSLLLPPAPSRGGGGGSSRADAELHSRGGKYGRGEFVSASETELRSSAQPDVAIAAGEAAVDSAPVVDESPRNYSSQAAKKIGKFTSNILARVRNASLLGGSTTRGKRILAAAAAAIAVVLSVLFVVNPGKALAAASAATAATEGAAESVLSSTATTATTAAATASAAAATASTRAMTAARPLGSLHLLPSRAELDLSLRLLAASLGGAAVGLERSSSDRPAGVRTMALVSLGAAAFSVCSMYGFLSVATTDPAAKFDPSRMASNVASGVGFIGAGVITNNRKAAGVYDRQSSVNGLTTAAAIWVSAAIGVACGTGLYFVGTAAALSTIGILRFGRVRNTEWGQRVVRSVGTKKGRSTSKKKASSASASSVDATASAAPGATVPTSVSSTTKGSTTTVVGGGGSSPTSSTPAPSPPSTTTTATPISVASLSEPPPPPAKAVGPKDLLEEVREREDGSVSKGPGSVNAAGAVVTSGSNDKKNGAAPSDGTTVDAGGGKKSNLEAEKKKKKKRKSGVEKDIVTIINSKGSSDKGGGSAKKKSSRQEEKFPSDPLLDKYLWSTGSTTSGGSAAPSPSSPSSVPRVSVEEEQEVVVGEKDNGGGGGGGGSSASASGRFP